MPLLKGPGNYSGSAKFLKSVIDNVSLVEYVFSAVKITLIFGQAGQIGPDRLAKSFSY